VLQRNGIMKKYFSLTDIRLVVVKYMTDTTNVLRIVQLTREEKTTLYSYIDNILEHILMILTEIRVSMRETSPIFLNNV
jgi:hypothetical protein